MDTDDIASSAPLAKDAFVAQRVQPAILTSSQLLASYPTVSNVEGTYNLYDTRAHRGVYDIVLTQANNLSMKNYVGTKGECCSTMVGAKGIGKTTCLRTFVQLCPLVVSDVYTVYINYNNILSSGRRLQLPLIDIVVQELAKHSLVFPDFDQELGRSKWLLDGLKKQNASVLILVDELDQLYKFDTDGSLNTLHDLAALGNQPSGRVSVIVCGSSAMMEALITTNADENVRKEFPLLRSAPNLNGTKYISKRVHTTLPTDLQAVATMVGISDVESNVKYLRFVAFAGGCSARTTGRLLHDSSAASGQLLLGLSPDTALSGNNTLAKDDLRVLRGAIVKGLYKKNRALMVELMGDKKGFSVSKIALVDWEVKFRPLDSAAISALWNKLLRKKLIPMTSSRDLLYNLYHLSDRCWLTIGSVANSAPDQIYPFSMFQLVKEHLAQEMLPTVAQELMEIVHAGAQKSGSYLANPRIVGAVAGSFAAAGASMMCSVM